MSPEELEGLTAAVAARRNVLLKRSLLTAGVGAVASGLVGLTAAAAWVTVVVGLHVLEGLLLKSPTFTRRRPRWVLALYMATSLAFCSLAWPAALYGGAVGLIGGGMLLASISYAFAVTARSSKVLFVAWETPVAAGYASLVAAAIIAHAQAGQVAALALMSGLCLLGVVSTWRENYAIIGAERQARQSAAAAMATERKAWQVAVMAEELAGVGHWRTEANAPLVQASRQVFRIFGLEPAGDFIPRDLIMAFVHPDDRERVDAMFGHSMITGESVSLKFRLVRNDQEIRHVILQGVAERDAQGQVCAIFGVFQDVTDQVRAAEALQRSEAQFRRMAENASDLITYSDVNGRLIYASPALEAITGFRPEEVIGRRTLELIHTDDLGLVTARTRQIAARPDHSLPPFEFRLRAKDGRWIWLESRPSPMVDPVTGKFQGVTDVVRDVSQRKSMEVALEAARLEAERAARIKGEFLANMSHELRTPLTSIVGFGQMLREDTALSADARQYADRVVVASEVLLATVNDILDFSKLEAGQVEIRPAPARLPTIAREIMSLFQTQAAARQVVLTVDYEAALEQALMLDADRLRQVLLNLVGNAVKFTAKGSVTVSAVLTADGERLRVSVIDTGRGVPKAELSRLFQRFSQVDGSIARDHGGTGLGLAICKGLVEAMGGAIHVESEEGRGSCFWFELPARFAATAATTAGDDDADEIGQLAGARVLVVDDHEANRELVRLLLTPLGCQVEAAVGGAEAVAMADGERFDVILMDLRMPGVDGAAACAAIRASKGPNADQPILAFTADASEDRATEVLSSGFDDHVAKPIKPADLLLRVAAWVDRQKVDPQRYADGRAMSA